MQLQVRLLLSCLQGFRLGGDGTLVTEEGYDTTKYYMDGIGYIVIDRHEVDYGVILINCTLANDEICVGGVNSFNRR